MPNCLSRATPAPESFYFDPDFRPDLNERVNFCNDLLSCNANYLTSSFDGVFSKSFHVIHDIILNIPLLYDETQRVQNKGTVVATSQFGIANQITSTLR